MKKILITLFITICATLFYMMEPTKNTLETLSKDAEIVRHTLDFESNFQESVFSSDYIAQVEEFVYLSAMNKEILHIIGNNDSNSTEYIIELSNNITSMILQMEKDKSSNKLPEKLADYCLEYWQKDLILIKQLQ